MHIAVIRKKLQETKINYSKKQANIKYYNYKRQKYITIKNKQILNITMQKFFFFFSKTYTYLINKLEHIEFITELDSERPFYGIQVKTAHFYIVK